MIVCDTSSDSLQSPFQSPPPPLHHPLQFSFVRCRRSTRDADANDTSLWVTKWVASGVGDVWIDADNRTYKEVKQRETKEKREDDYIPADISRKILNMAHEQQVGVEGAT